MKGVLINLPNLLISRTIRSLERVFALQSDGVRRIILEDRDMTQLRCVIVRGSPALWERRIQDGQRSGYNAEEDVDNNPRQFLLIRPREIHVVDNASLDYLSHDAANARNCSNGEQKAQSDLLPRGHPHLIQDDQRHHQEGKVKCAVDDC